MQMLQQAVGEILHVQDAFAQIGIGNLGHAGTGIAQRLGDRRIGGKARADPFADTGQPAAVLGEHAVGFQYLHMFLAAPLAANFFHHFVERAMHALHRLIEPVEFRGRVLGDDLADLGAAFVDYRLAYRQPAVEPCALESERFECDTVGGGELIR
jgi:hypothetical protein